MLVLKLSAMYTIYIFDSDLFLYTRNLENERLKPVLSIKLPFEFLF